MARKIKIAKMLINESNPERREVFAVDEDGGMWIYRAGDALHSESGKTFSVIRAKNIGSLPEGSLEPHRWHVLSAKTGEWLSDVKGLSVADVGFKQPPKF